MTLGKFQIKETEFKPPITFMKYTGNVLYILHGKPLFHYIINMIFIAIKSNW